MKNIHLFGLLVIVIIFSGCLNRQQKANRAFLEEFKNTDFNHMRNVGFWIRGCNLSDICYVLVCSDHSNNCPQGTYIAEVDRKTKSIISRDCRLLKDSISFNKVKFDSLALNFASFRVHSLSVDSLSNVYLSTSQDQGTTLIKFVDTEHITFPKNEKWRNIEGLWYERID